MLYNNIRGFCNFCPSLNIIKRICKKEMRVENNQTCRFCENSESIISPETCCTGCSILEKKTGEFTYLSENYPGPIAIDCKPSKECDEYHKNSKVQINLPRGFE
jgi:hypothetical protein